MVCIEKRPQNVAVHQPLVLNISPVYLTGGISSRGGFGFWIEEQSLSENRKIPVSYDTGLIFL